MLKNDTLKNGRSRIGLYGSAPRVLKQPSATEVAAYKESINSEKDTFQNPFQTENLC